jgi:hypothetical protein
MDFFTLTADELHALEGLPYIQQVLYFRGIRPYMDRRTRITGIKRRISYQSLCEALYVEPIAGVQTLGSPNHQQVRRAVKQLIDNGLIKIIPAKRQLIFQCILALRDKFVQNKADIRPTDQADSRPTDDKLDIMGLSETFSSQANRPKTPQADTPHKDNNYLFFLLQKFETFWESYPQKQGKQKAWEAFQHLNPDEQLTQKIMNALKTQVTAINEKQALGLWVPNWKHPANWLTQQSWEDEVIPVTAKEIKHASHRQHHPEPVDMFWESCKSGAEDDSPEESNVIDLISYREGM